MKLRQLTAITVLCPCIEGFACDANYVVAACGPVACASGVNRADVSILAFLFQPQALTIPVGATVHWLNNDPSDHTVTSLSSMELFDSGLMAPDEEFNHLFQTLGSIPYVCAIHFGMDGEVRVRGPGDATGDNRTDISDFAILAANFNLTERTYVTGDFDLTGTTNISDFAILAANFNQTFLQRTSIPEPTMIAWSALIPSALRRRARTSGCRLQSAPCSQ